MRVTFTLLALTIAAPAAAQSPITTWCGGGVTGGGTITRLARTTASAPETATPLGQDEAAFRRWTAALNAAGLSRLPSTAPGNMTCTLSQGTTTLRWPGGPPPAAVAGVVEEMRRWRP